MKLSYEAYGKTVTIETDNDDATMAELYELMQRLALAAGYHHETVEEWLPEEK